MLERLVERFGRVRHQVDSPAAVKARHAACGSAVADQPYRTASPRPGKCPGPRSGPVVQSSGTPRYEPLPGQSGCAAGAPPARGYSESCRTGRKLTTPTETKRAGPKTALSRATSNASLRAEASKSSAIVQWGTLGPPSVVRLARPSCPARSPPMAGNSDLGSTHGDDPRFCRHPWRWVTEHRACPGVLAPRCGAVIAHSLKRTSLRAISPPLAMKSGPRSTHGVDSRFCRHPWRSSFGHDARTVPIIAHSLKRRRHTAMSSSMETNCGFGSACGDAFRFCGHPWSSAPGHIPERAPSPRTAQPGAWT